MRYLLFLCALIIGDAHSQEIKKPIPPVSGKAETPNERKDNTADQQSISIELPSTVNINVTGKLSVKAEQEESSGHEEPTNWAEWLIALFTFALVFVTGWLVYYTKNLWASTSDLVKDARQAEAPHFFARVVEHTGFTAGRPAPQGSRAFFTYGFVNQGRTSGTIRRFRDYTRWGTIEEAPQFGDQPWNDRPDIYVPIPPGEPTGFALNAQIPPTTTGAQVFAGFAEGRSLFIVCEIEYEDIFDHVWIHGFCLEVRNMIPTQIDGQDRMLFVTQRAGGTNYNYRREPQRQQ